uniref:Groucho/TLE N-terminal Q-rich domain-containing protein n=1 Tax=Amphilophus citrinellus TaxID=61819 RepID=A0A3Q0RB91_AMPCI
MSYGLNIEMHKQTEIAKRLNTICAQTVLCIPFIHSNFTGKSQQVVQAVERAKQVTMAELNAVIGQQHLSHNHGGAPVPLTPHPAGLHPSQLGGSASLLALSGALGAIPPHLAGKESADKKPHLSGQDSHPP